MMKKLLYGLAALVLLLLLGLLALTRLVDTERVKRVLVEQTREKTGRTLVIEGDLSWRFFPSLGFTLGRTSLMNPPGFAEGATLSVGGISLDVALRPLLDNRLEVGEAVLDNARLHLITRADGVSNIDDLRALAGGGEPAPVADEPAGGRSGGGEPTAPMSVSLAGVRVNNAEVLLQDEAGGSLTRLNRVNLALDRFAPGESVPLSLSGDLFSDEVQANIRADGLLWLAADGSRLRLDQLALEIGATGRAIPGNKQLRLGGGLDYDIAGRQLAFNHLQLEVGSLALDGSLSLEHAPAIPRLRFSLHTALLDLDQLAGEWGRPQSSAAGATPASSEAAATLPPSVASPEPDLSWLSRIDVQGELAADRMRVQGMEMEQLTLKLALGEGRARFEPIRARLYGGELDGRASLDATRQPAAFSMRHTLGGVAVRPLLSDAAGLDYLEGRGELVLDVSGRGLSSAALLPGLTGSSRLRVDDGAVHGVNIPAMIRRGYAQVKGQPLPAEEAVQKTDFSALTADFTIAGGKVSTDNLNMASPLLRIHGEGQTNLRDQSIDVLLNTAVVGSLKGQDGEELSELKNITLPVRISGTYQQPRYGLDMQQVFDRYLKDKVDREAQRLQERLNEKLGDELGDKLQQRLPGLLDKLGL